MGVHGVVGVGTAIGSDTRRQLTRITGIPHVSLKAVSITGSREKTFRPHLQRGWQSALSSGHSRLTAKWLLTNQNRKWLMKDTRGGQQTRPQNRKRYSNTTQYSNSNSTMHNTPHNMINMQTTLS